MKKEKKPYEFNLQAFVIAVLRRASYRSKPRSEALYKARISRGTYQCKICSKSFGRKEIAVDHKEPVVPTRGWDGWDGFIRRLFCDVSGLQVLCKACHKEKTQAENKERRENNKKVA